MTNRGITGEACTAFFDTAFAGVPVLAILRGYSPTRTVELSQRAWDAGIEHVEVPISSPEALDSLAAAVAAGAACGRCVGAGTVVGVDQVRAVAAAGATFTVAPGFDAEIVDASLAAGLPHLPGVGTASEVQQAAKRGLHWVKAFPAASLGAPWVAAIRAPFPHVRVVATGGVSAANAEEFWDAGARVVSLGSALEDPAQLEAIVEICARRRSVSS